MITTTNELLLDNNIDPAKVRLIRHKDKRCKVGKSVYNLWMNDKSEFDKYNTIQGFRIRPHLKSDYWMVFLGRSKIETIFIGLYEVISRNVLDKDTTQSCFDIINYAGTCDKYQLRLTSVGEEYIGKMNIEWGNGYLAYIQKANNQNKKIVSL